MWSYIIDGILILILLVCIISGIIRGLFDSVLHLVGSGLAIVASVFLAKYVANFINKLFNFEDWILTKLEGGEQGHTNLFNKINLDNVELAKFTVWIISVVIVFLAIKLLLLILTKVLESATQKSKTLSGINRVLGMIFGIARGAVIALACLAVCSLIAQVPVIGDPVYKEVSNATITGKVFKFVDDFVEKNITAEGVQDIIDRIVSDNTSDNTNKDTSSNENNGNTLSSPYISIDYVEDGGVLDSTSI
jgi:uncharacterized membrane protein required for colicin V production